MKSYLKIITNIILTSIGLSVVLGTSLRILGPINQNNKILKNIIFFNKNKKPYEKIFTRKNTNLINLLKSNSIEERDFTKLEELILRWKTIIKKNPDLEVSGFFLSSDHKTYADINSNISFPAASSIKIPILIVLLQKVGLGEILWNEELTLTKEVLAGGSGWMAYQRIGEVFPIFEVALEMIRVSDNTATNLLIKRLGGIEILNESFKNLGLQNTKIENYLPDLQGTNLTSTKDLALTMALVDSGYFLDIRSRDIFREIMSKSKTNSLIPKGILRGLGKDANDIDYHLLIKGYLVHNKTGDIGISYSDTASIETPYNSRAFASFIVKGPFNDPRSTELIRNLSAELIPFLRKK